MADEEQLRILKEEGLGAWNKWRKHNRDVKPNLEGANLREASLREANLTRANLTRANLEGANLTRAKLHNANLNRAKLYDANLEGANLTRADLEGAKLYDANLEGANLNRAKLYDADLLIANLNRANLRGANLEEVNLEEANLTIADLRGADLEEANLRGANLEGADLRGANLEGVNLEEANLTIADLEEANLKKVQALATNFNGAILTGACIKDWNINSETNLENVICDYIYLKQGQQERRPADPNRNFEPGEFAKLVEQSIHTVDLVFKEGIDWRAFLSSFQDLQIEYGHENVSIRAIEKKSDGAFVIRLDVPTDVDKANVETSFWQVYRPILRAKDEQIALYGQELKCKRKENTRLLGIIETMAARDDELLNEAQINILKAIEQENFHDSDISNHLGLKIHTVRYHLKHLKDNEFIQATEHYEGDGKPGEIYYSNCNLTYKGQVAVDNPNDLIKETKMSSNVNNFNAPVGSVGNQGTQTNVTGVVEGDQIGTQYNSPQEKTLAEAADEIQKLLQQLEQANPDATVEQQEAYVDAAMPKTLKERLISALSAMGDTAIEEFLQRPGVKVVASGVKAWMLPDV